MDSLSPPAFSVQLETLRAREEGSKVDIFFVCWHAFSPSSILPSPVLKAKATDFPLAKLLIPWRMSWACSETCSPTMKCTNPRQLGTYCQVNQGALPLTYYFGQRRAKKAREGEGKEFCSTVEMLGWWPKPVFVTSHLHITGDIFPALTATYHLSIIYLNYSSNLSRSLHFKRKFDFAISYT